jgi:hypothetical protein
MQSINARFTIIEIADFKLRVKIEDISQELGVDRIILNGKYPDWCVSIH